MKKNSALSRYGLPAFSFLIFLFLYIPIIILIVFSFNRSPVPYIWRGFSTEWYYELFTSPDLLNAFANSFIVACSAVLLSLFLGILYIFFSAPQYLEKLLLLSYANLAIPEVVIAVGLLSLFTYLFVPLGLTTLIAGHTLLGLSYVIPILQARFSELDIKYTEASLDLGATPLQTLWYVMVPLLAPALVSGGLLVFIISLDDFVISFFIAGGTTQTLPLYIFSVIRSGATPVVNALSTILLLMSSVVVMVFSFIQLRKYKTL